MFATWRTSQARFRTRGDELKYRLITLGRSLFAELDLVACSRRHLPRVHYEWTIGIAEDNCRWNVRLTESISNS